MLFRYALICASLLVLCALLSPLGNAQPPASTNPFAPPKGKVQVAPERDYDLRHVRVELDIDYPKQTFRGTATSTIVPLKGTLSRVRLHCGDKLNITAATVNNKPVKFVRDGKFLVLSPTKALPAARFATVSVTYSGGTKQGGGFGSDGGFHWMIPSDERPDRIGFWTQGESGYNSEWAPMWDYPNDFATSETITTVPDDWSVIGNGVLVSETQKANKRKTYHWKMTQPHATYLLSLTAGPFAIQKAQWEDVPLWYVVPKSKGDLIEPSFSDTPDMLTFFSNITGVKYPWPKYAQNAMYDFGGGMENVSSTTLGASSLTDSRSGYRDMASLNSHELAHQWFGDLVTCKTWGDAWLNESFATFMESLYTEHVQGKSAYEREIEGNMQGYFSEAKRYQRPISTNIYPNDDAVFDSHAYPKGGVVLHGLKHYMGEKAFWAGIKYYLTQYRHQPVDVKDFTKAMSKGGGVNIEQYVSQWILKPGHPVIEYSQEFDAAKSEVVLSIKQTQDTKNGTPIYEIPTHVWLRISGKEVFLPVTLKGEAQEIRLPATQKPEAVLLDPYHAFLREMKRKENANEDITLALFAPNAVDKMQALTRIMATEPDAATVQQLTEAVKNDTGQFPIYGTIRPFTQKPNEALRPLFTALLSHPNANRRAEAISALGKLPVTTPEEKEAEAKHLREIVASKTSMYVEVEAALGVLLQRDTKSNLPTLLSLTTPNTPRALRLIALRRLGDIVSESARINPVLVQALSAEDFMTVLTSVQTLRARKDVSVLPELKKLQESKDKKTSFLPAMLKRLINDLDPK
jgi:aminopeptidase N